MPWGDPTILTEILRQARTIRDPGARKRFKLAAVQTGLVESGGRNLNYGHADSLGWRQERASIYRNPRNVKASVRRFRNEFLQQYDPGEASYQVAAQVQRPAAQYRGRYRQADAEARAILAGHGGTGPGPGGAPAPGGGGFMVPGGQSLAALLESLGQRERATPAGGRLPDPGFSARAALALPDMYAEFDAGQAPAPKQDTLSALLAGVQTPGGGFPLAGPGDGQNGTESGQGGGRGRTAESIVDDLDAWARRELGISGGSRDRDRRRNASVGGSADSDHLEEPRAFRGREAIDLPTTAARGGWSQYRKVARRFGLEPAGNGFTEGTVRVGRKRFRVQVIFGDQHRHGDHIHVGVRRIG